MNIARCCTYISEGLMDSTRVAHLFFFPTVTQRFFPPSFLHLSPLITFYDLSDATVTNFDDHDFGHQPDPK